MQRNTVDHLGQRTCVDPMQSACHQSTAMARDVVMRQEQWKGVWKKAWARNQGNKTTHNTPGLVSNITRCFQQVEATWDDAFTNSLKDNNQSHSPKEKTGR